MGLARDMTGTRPSKPLPTGTCSLRKSLLASRPLCWRKLEVGLNGSRPRGSGGAGAGGDERPPWMCQPQVGPRGPPMSDRSDSPQNREKEYIVIRSPCVWSGLLGSDRCY